MPPGGEYACCCAADMVWSRERETERPPLSVILPRLYLGAERDVTQVRTTLVLEEQQGKVSIQLGSSKNRILHVKDLHSQFYL